MASQRRIPQNATRTGKPPNPPAMTALSAHYPLCTYSRRQFWPQRRTSFDVNGWTQLLSRTCLGTKTFTNEIQFSRSIHGAEVRANQSFDPVSTARVELSEREATYRCLTLQTRLQYVW